jgi:RNA polymerase sigma-70 factor (ECF subfamily)
MRLCHCRETAHEVTQEAFITAFSRLRQFRGDAPFWGWMRRVVINHAISTMRRASRASVVELEEHHAHIDAQQERVGQSMDLEAALAALDDDDRAVVWLHDVEGYNHAEIAQMYGLTESFSKTRLSRARARLREWVAGPENQTAVNEAAN